MARMRGPRFKQSRRLGLNVCGHPKAMNRAGNGQERDRKKLSAYGMQLLEKQRLRGYYEVMEKQFRKYVIKAIKSDELSGEALVKMLETRLDNMVYRMHFASSIRQARQMVVHGHIKVNGQKVDRPSFAIKVGDVLSLREKSQKVDMFKENLENAAPTVPYVSLDADKYQGTLTEEPKRDQVPIEINDHLVIEYYSKVM
ncbi:30S ribosomal protein S4 [Acidaminobacter sp. JC074]|uniref:30S ribosomal protein S4 n=1 Tax=Acidaminobacter sp. JC074 TaxID=2530199 RepID=UPI001F101E6B|nr:30S ribosomal protein S4 [Acidaminobacter sp. JC074]MCH4891056.1 30S ribosomal protein S4 [Acidaminobacter sp. JC074]